MPRKALFSKDEIIENAIKLVRESGFETLSARSLGNKMGCSTSPLFTVYGSFEAIKEDVQKRVIAIFNAYVADALNYQPAFKEYGRRLVYFGKNEPNLFRALQMCDHKAIYYTSPVEDACQTALVKDYGLTREQASLLFAQMYTFASGLAIEAVYGRTELSDEEINKRLGVAFMSTMMFLKSHMEVATVVPHVREEGDEKLTLDIPFLGKDEANRGE